MRNPLDLQFPVLVRKITFRMRKIIVRMRQIIVRMRKIAPSHVTSHHNAFQTNHSFRMRLACKAFFVACEKLSIACEINPLPDDKKTITKQQQ